MIVTVNLYGHRAFAYTESIEQMRSLLARHGGRTGYFRLDIVLEPGGAPEARLLMSRRTLYIDAFEGAGGIWHYFKDSPKPADARLGIAGNVAPLMMNGTHHALGTDTDKCKYNPYTRMGLRDLARYRTKDNDSHLRLPLSFAVVSCAEAVRFKEAEQTIQRLLNGGADTSYEPFADWSTTYSDWEKLTKAGSARVWVRHPS